MKYRKNMRKLIFEKASNEPNLNYIPKIDILETEIDKLIPKRFLREEIQLPNIPEVEIVRHYTNLSQKNYGVDNGIYPLGSCTMKYNPKINEKVASLSGFTKIHPYQKGNIGALKLISQLSKWLCEITGMHSFTLFPAAGAHGELTGMLIIKKYFEENGIQKNKIIVPDSAHGTNPASAKMAGFSIIELQSNELGEIPIDHLEFAMEEDDVAGIMLTNPNTLGVFERKIQDITKIVHEHGGLCYYDGANLNPMLGISKPGDMGFDIVHINLHKTFSTPHGGGGPGSGPVGVTEKLYSYLPNPQVIDKGNGEFEFKKFEKSIGKIRCFWGNFGVLVKAFSYIRSLGAEGLKDVAKISVLNANYLRAHLEKEFKLPFKRLCKHEFVLSDKDLENNINTEDIAKRILDFGIYAPTIYFPLIVEGAMMIEPTETESKESLDYFIAVMKQIRDEIKNNPEKLKMAPQNTFVKRLNAVLAARNPILHE
jgi:glycine dehydrogenase subunit 2